MNLNPNKGTGQIHFTQSAPLWERFNNEQVPLKIPRALVEDMVTARNIWKREEIVMTLQCFNLKSLDEVP